MGMLKEGVRLDRVRGGRQKYRRGLSPASQHANTCNNTSNGPLPAATNTGNNLIGGSTGATSITPDALTISNNAVSETNKIMAALINSEPDILSASSLECLYSLPASLSGQMKTLYTLSYLFDQELVSLITWAKQLPGFSETIALNDQMRLLQSTWAEVIALSIAYRSHLRILEFQNSNASNSANIGNLGSNTSSTSSSSSNTNNSTCSGNISNANINDTCSSSSRHQAPLQHLHNHHHLHHHNNNNNNNLNQQHHQQQQQIKISSSPSSSSPASSASSYNNTCNNNSSSNNSNNHNPFVQSVNDTSSCLSLNDVSLVFAKDLIIDLNHAIACGVDEIFYNCVQLIKRLNSLKITQKEYMILKALSLTNADVRLENPKTTHQLRDSILDALNELILSYDIPQINQHRMNQLLMCLPVLRQIDSSIRKFWNDIRRGPNNVPMKSLFEEMLEPCQKA